MDAVSLPRYHRDRSQWLRLLAVFALLWLLALLVFVAGLVEIGPTAPGDRILVGPFRWQPTSPLAG